MGIVTNADKYKLLSCLNTGELHTAGKPELVMPWYGHLQCYIVLNTCCIQNIKFNEPVIEHSNTIILEGNSAHGFSCC